MEFSHILSRFAEGLVDVDGTTSTITFGRAKNGVRPEYLRGVPSMYENAVAREILNWWVSAYPDEFVPADAHAVEQTYPGVSGASCDLVFSSDGSWPNRPEWAVEFKRLQFVGDNGKKNDHGVQKMLSPYLKDRSLIHDIRRMIEYPIAKNHAVMGYSFRYDYESCNEALIRHPIYADRINEVRKVCKENDPISGELNPEDLLAYAHRQFSSEGVISDFASVKFDGAWRHPCGGAGVVFGWVVDPPTGDQVLKRIDAEKSRLNMA